jgi:hypothetical protein
MIDVTQFTMTLTIGEIIITLSIVMIIATTTTNAPHRRSGTDTTMSPGGARNRQTLISEGTFLFASKNHDLSAHVK